MANSISTALELHLFFLRIMREHAFFLEAGFPCKDKEWIEQADWYRGQFEQLLREAVCISNGWIGADVLQSEELSTQFTAGAEKKTEQLSGVAFDRSITEAERKLCAGAGSADRNIRGQVRRLNERAFRLLNGLIRFKENLLHQMRDCQVYNANYPLLVEHILREAKLYRDLLLELMRRGCIHEARLYDIEAFWNQIMMEHALFIRGLLDPTEEELIETADGFAQEYRRLLKEAACKEDAAAASLRESSLAQTEKYRAFKAAGTEGILACNIQSVILPLLADHVLREANHYIRMLRHNG